MSDELEPKYEQVDLARLAAYIDGEGSVYIKHPQSAGNWYQLIIDVCNTDERLTLWCKEKFGGWCLPGKTRGGRRPLFRWRITSERAANVLRACIRYSVIKREQMAIALLFAQTVQNRGGRKSGWFSKLTPRKIVLREFCREAIHQLKNIPKPSLEAVAYLWPQGGLNAYGLR